MIFLLADTNEHFSSLVDTHLSLLIPAMPPCIMGNQDRRCQPPPEFNVCCVTTWNQGVSIPLFRCDAPKRAEKNPGDGNPASDSCPAGCIRDFSSCHFKDGVFPLQHRRTGSHFDLQDIIRRLLVHQKSEPALTLSRFSSQQAQTRHDGLLSPHLSREKENCFIPSRLLVNSSISEQLEEVSSSVGQDKLVGLR